LTSPDQSEAPKVLIVEDEMMLRLGAVDLVEQAGFCPVQAVDADEAISILEARSDISLLFTDIQMPGSMDGLKLAHAVHDRWPAIKIILVSGQITPSESERPAQSRFFGKPINLDKMIPAMRAMLLGAGTGPDDAHPERPDDASTLGSARSGSASSEALSAENDVLRFLLEQASVDAAKLLAQAGIEAEQRATANELQRLVMGELHHRIKNTLATVSAIASQSFRSAVTIEDGQKALDGRLLALSRAHDLLLQTSWSSASLVETLNSSIEPFDERGARRFNFNGPDLKINSAAVIALAMTFNELCTNAIKFGALTVAAGRVDVGWTVTGENRVRLRWTERNGPPVQPPSRRSFGTRMMESLGQQLRGRIELSYNDDGFVYDLDIPLASLQADDRA
jgi:two-component sensor histidine kinase/DNA-binding NarL/FixJ family response regulator